MKRRVIFFLLLFTFNAVVAQTYETILDNFQNNSNDWYLSNRKDYHAIIEDNSYLLTNDTETEKVFLSTFIIDPNYDYTIEAKFTKISGDKRTDFGLIWGNYIDRDNLAFLINSQKKFHIKGKFNKHKYLIKNWDRCRKINKTGTPNTLTIKKKGRTIKYYINDKRVYTSVNYPLIGTELGFVLSGKSILNVEYVKVSALKKNLYLVENPINGHELQNLGPMVNSEFSERGPVISPDGKTLYITRTHPDNINGLQTDDIWITQLDEYNKWNKIEHLGKPLNNESNNFVISITPDGNSMLVGNTYKRDGSPDRSGISVATKRDGEWQVPKKQSIKNYTNEDPYGSFFLSPDGTKLIICAENEESYGDLDLFVSFLRKPGRWSEPINLGTGINTFAPDFSPFLASDGKTLYFASYGHKGYGKSDIFVTKRLDETWQNWSPPKNLGPEINSEGWDAYYCTSALSDFAYMVSSKRSISYGLEDIFKIEIMESAKPDPVVLVAGDVYNKKTNERINAEIKYENLRTGIDEGIAYSTINDGYKLVFPKGESYGFRAVSNGYYAVSQNIDLSDIDAFEEKRINLYLVPIERGLSIRLNNIFFDFDKAIIQNRSFSELNRLIEVLRENPEISIAISGHTDSKGSNDYNLTLSENRAQAVRQYIINQNIKASRVTAKGYGETIPIDSNETEEGRQLNRRVEFVIL